MCKISKQLEDGRGKRELKSVRMPQSTSGHGGQCKKRGLAYYIKALLGLKGKVKIWLRRRYQIRQLYTPIWESECLCTLGSIIDFRNLQIYNRRKELKIICRQSTNWYPLNSQKFDSLCHNQWWIVTVPLVLFFLLVIKFCLISQICFGQMFYFAYGKMPRWVNKVSPKQK